jgi:DNA repair photolyase
LTRFNLFHSRSCPERLEVNVYTGCAFQCTYCFARAYIRDFDKPRCKQNFEKRLERDIKDALRLGLDKLPVSISNSCEPFQPLEDKYRHALLAIKLLTESGFRILILTKNPAKLLDIELLEAMDSKKTFIEATIPFQNSKFFEPNALPTTERIQAVAELIKHGFTVAVRVDPIIPQYGNIPGQTASEIETLIEKLHDARVKFIIAKCQRLVGATAKVHPELYYGLRPFYVANGSWTGNCYELKDEVKQKLHVPIYQACNQHNMLYSTCLDNVHFPNSVRCDRSSSFFMMAIKR